MTTYKADSVNNTLSQEQAQQSSNNTRQIDANEVRQAFQLLTRPGFVYEVRCLNATLRSDRLPYNKPRTINGYFNDVEKLLVALKQVASATGIYLIPNPCQPALLAHTNNRFRDKDHKCVKDEEIIARHVMLLDFDPKREGGITGIPTTNEESKIAADFAQAARAWLAAHGFSEPIEIDSGNGRYLIITIDLPADDNGLVENVLKAMAQELNTKQIHVDTGTFNQSRLMRLPGTWNCKGDGTEDRPYRISKIVSTPEDVRPEPTELLETIASLVKQEQPKQEQKSAGKNEPRKQKNQGALPTVYLDKWDVAYGPQEPYNGGLKWPLVDGCPFCGNNDHCAFVYIDADGVRGYKCSHTSTCDSKYHWKEFEQHFKTKARGDTTTYSPGQEHSSELPQVILGGQLREIRDHALQALGEYEEANPTIFIQSGRLVQIGHDESHKAIIRPMGTAEMKNALTRAADFFTMRKDGEDLIQVPAKPPKDIAEAILALDPSQWPFLPLIAIVEVPVISPDGTILQTPGYDAQTRLYYAPHKDMHTCKVPENPSGKEVQDACAILEDIIAEFPFVAQSDRANMLALMITPIIRPAIKRHVPLALIDAPKQGTGKGLLSDIVSIIATGEPASILTAPNNEEEWTKKITSILMSGSTIVTIDNIPGRLQSSKLDAVLTADWWTDRLLGGNTMVRVPQRAVWLATGNNIKVGGDLARRCYRVRIDPQISKPWNRTGFKYEDLATHVKEQRSEKVTAILTLVRAWFVAGCPIDKNVPSLGTFTGWARMVGSILSFAGIEGFLQNLDKLYDEMDVENAQWALFLQAWQDMFGEKAIPVKMLIAALAEEKENDTPNQNTFDDLNEGSTGGAEKATGGALAEFLPDNLQTALKEKPKSFNIILGKALESKRDACFGEKDLRLEKVKNTDAKQWTWKVVTGGTGSANTPNAQEKNSSSSSTQNENEEKNDKYDLGMDDYPYHPYEESVQNGKNATNQGAKPIEPLVDTQQENMFSGPPPVNSNRPPVNLDDLPDEVRQLYIKLRTDKKFNLRSGTFYLAEYLSLEDFYKWIEYDLQDKDASSYSMAVEALQQKLAEVSNG